MFNSQCSILIRTAGGRTSPSGSDRSRRSYLAWGERRAIRHPLLDGCALLLDVSRYRAHAPRGLAFAAAHLRLRIAHWELNIGRILGLMRSSGYCQVIFARALSDLFPYYLRISGIA